MGLVEIFIVALGLSVDSFAVSVCTGLVNQKLVFFKALRIAFVFALIQGLAPVLGGFLGVELRVLIKNLDHWIALLLLLLIGGKMIYDGLRKGKPLPTGNILQLKSLILMGIATSIDAVVVGVTMGLVEVILWKAGIIIGLVTFMAAMIGLFLGSRFSGFTRMKLEVIAGMVLIGIGLKIFIEHLVQQV